MSRATSRLKPSLLAAALIAVPLASCVGITDLLNLSQKWTLQTVRDSTLPYTIPNASHDIVINSAVANLHSDNTYTFTFTGTLDGAAGTVGSDAGEWSVMRSAFIFHSATFHTDYIAGLVGTTFRATVPGQVVNSSNANFYMVFAKNP